MTIIRKTLNFAAWIVLAISLFQPMERHTLPGPCTWPCVYPYTYLVLDNTPIFILAPLFVPIYLISDLGTAVAFVVYSFVGVGEIMVFLVPFLDGKITQKGSKYIFLLSFISVLSVLSYALFPALRLGVYNLMMGYYGLTLSFLLMFVSAIIRLTVNNKKTSVENN